jgi:hypothetical protein
MEVYSEKTPKLEDSKNLIRISHKVSTAPPQRKPCEKCGLSLAECQMRMDSDPMSRLGYRRHEGLKPACQGYQLAGFID